MTSFINNIIVKIEEEEGYNEAVEEVVKRLAENNLYIKLEKCKWKVREVEFFRSSDCTGNDEDKKKKVKEVLDWLISKGVKDIYKFL